MSLNLLANLLQFLHWVYNDFFYVKKFLIKVIEINLNSKIFLKEQHIDVSLDSKFISSVGNSQFWVLKVAAVGGLKARLECVCVSVAETNDRKRMGGLTLPSLFSLE